MKLLLTIALVLFACASPFAQEYRITKTLSLNGAAAFASLQYGRKDYGYGLITSQGTMAWQLPAPGYPLGMGKLHDNVIVFYISNDPALHFINDIHAAIIDVKAHKIIADKLVYGDKSRYVTDPVICNDPAGNFDFILIRNTNQKRGYGGMSLNGQQQFFESSKLSAISFDDNLAMQTKEIKSAAPGAFFLSACVGNDHELYICTYDNDQVTAEKFNPDYTLKNKLSTATSIKNFSKIFPLATYDSISSNSIDLAVAYKNSHKDDVIRSYRFDFTNQKVYSTDESVLDKGYKETLEKLADKRKLSNFKLIDDLYPVQIIETADKVIVMKEIQYMESEKNGTQQFYRPGSIVSVYTKKDLHLERDIIIDKYFGTFIMGGTDIAGHIKDGKLYTATCELSSPGKYKTYLYTININDGSMEKKELEKDDAGKGWITDPTVIAWFGDKYIVPFNSGKAFIRLKFETELQVEKY